MIYETAQYLTSMSFSPWIGSAHRGATYKCVACPRIHTRAPCQKLVDIPRPWKQHHSPLPHTKGTCSKSSFQLGNSRRRWSGSPNISPAAFKSHLSKALLKIRWHLMLPWKHLLRPIDFVSVWRAGGYTSSFFLLLLVIRVSVIQMVSKKQADTVNSLQDINALIYSRLTVCVSKHSLPINLKNNIFKW